MDRKPLDHQSLDITDCSAVARTVEQIHPDVIINCAAFNDVDGAQDRVVEALGVNALAVLALSQAAQGIGGRLIHYSTDFVFDGEAGTPYTEADLPSPHSSYGLSKLLGEWFALEGVRPYVLRVESLFGHAAERRGSVDAILSNVRQGLEVPVFVDRTVSPSYVDDVAEATAVLLDSEAPGGLYHCVNSGHATWYELGVEIARLLHRRARLTAVRVADVPMRASRPRYCVLSNAKLTRAGVSMPTWQDALARYVARVRGGP